MHIFTSGIPSSFERVQDLHIIPKEFLNRICPSSHKFGISEDPKADEDGEEDGDGGFVEGDPPKGVVMLLN